MDKSCAGPLGGAQTLTFRRRQVPASSAGVGASRARSRCWGERRNSLVFVPLPLPSRRLEDGGGAGARAWAWRGVQNARYSGARGPLDSPQPPSHSRNWGKARGGGWGRAGTSLRLSLFSRSLSPHPLPVGLCLGNLGPSIPHSRKRDFAGANFLKFESQGAGGWEAEDGRRDFDSFDWQCRPFGRQKKKIPCSLGPRLLRQGCHTKKMSSPRRTPSSPTPHSNLKLRNRERWLRKISNVCTLTISCPAPDGIVFHSGATQMVPQSGLKSFTLPPPVPSGRCWLLDTCRFKKIFFKHSFARMSCY